MASLYVIFSLPIPIVMVDSIISILLFSILGLSLWYVTFGLRFEKKRMLDFIIRHILALIVFVVVWISLSEFFSLLILKNSEPLSAVNIRTYKVIEGSFLYSITIVAYYLQSYYKSNKEKQINEEQLLRNLRETELRVLKSQINPHFLFNSLNTVSSLSITNPEAAQKTIVRLSEYLRYSLKMNLDDLIPIEKEIENCKRYLGIEKERFGEKLTYSFDFNGDCKNINVPVLLLQPLYENAVKHGVYESDDVVNIDTKLSCDDECLTVKIVNNFDPDAITRKGEGIGLSSIYSRLRLVYGIADLLTTSKKENLFIVELNIPRKKHEV
jgi:LytS/YehU family sensor histidine kinase